MHGIGAQVHHYEHNVGLVCNTLAVAEEFRIIHRMKVQALIALAGWIFATDSIQLSNNLLQTLTMLEVQRADMVLFRIEIFLTAFEAGKMLAEFEGRAIDAIEGAECSGQY